jgi:hypothetical protein
MAAENPTTNIKHPPSLARNRQVTQNHVFLGTHNLLHLANLIYCRLRYPTDATSLHGVRNGPVSKRHAMDGVPKRKVINPREYVP